MRPPTSIPGEVPELVASMAERQRTLRSAYGTARYGWPETLASEWARRPETFEEREPVCRVARFLEAATPYGR